MLATVDLLRVAVARDTKDEGRSRHWPMPWAKRTAGT
jgi:hypothetical protein